MLERLPSQYRGAEMRSESRQAHRVLVVTRSGLPELAPFSSIGQSCFKLEELSALIARLSRVRVFLVSQLGWLA